MKKLSLNEISKKINDILKLKTFNMRTFLWMSSIYALVWIILACSPHELHKLFAYGDVLYKIKELIILTLGYLFWVYLPEIVICIFDFIVKKIRLNDKNIIKTIRILILILSYVYLVVLGILLFAVIRGAMLLFSD